MFPDVVAQDLWALEKQQEMFDYEDDGYEIWAKVVRHRAVHAATWSM